MAESPGSIVREGYGVTTTSPTSNDGAGLGDTDGNVAH